MSYKEKIKEILSNIPALFLTLKDSRNPLLGKVMAFLTVSYAVSPIDLIPDFIPFVGYLDDMVILPLLTFITLKFVDKEIFNSYKQQLLDKDFSIEGKWYYSLPIIACWVIIIVIIYLKFIAR